MQGFREFSEIPWRTYGLIVADPPWIFRNYSAKGEKKNPISKYNGMSIKEIAAIPVSLYAADDCILWLWATNPMLDQQIDILKGWGFKFVTSGAWHKKTKHGKDHFGTGYALRGSGEPYLIGKIGKPKFAKNVRSHFAAKAREDSRKPDLAYENAARMAVGAEHRLDLFSRQLRPGWDAFGDQYDWFPPYGDEV
jgi:N6-adenosine-specific RNA methylase IME4